jgi:hypothetical protein
MIKTNEQTNERFILNNKENTETQSKNFVSSWIKSAYKSNQIYNQILKFIPILPMKKQGKSLSLYKSDDTTIVGVYIKYTDETNSTISYNKDKKTLYIKENKVLKDQIDDLKVIASFLDVFQEHYKPVSYKKVAPAEN